MRRRFALASLLFAWLCANGALWDAAQVVAWGKMFAVYSATMSVTDALRETMNPAKPCKMCLGIKRAKQATEKQLPAGEQHAAAKFVLAIQPADTPVFADANGDWAASYAVAPRDWTDSVPVPPPRA